MTITRKHRDAEARFRELLSNADLPEPDRVGYEPESVVFYWDEPKVAVFVDFEQDHQSDRRAASQLRSRPPISAASFGRDARGSGAVAR
jgi:hypothetical protein